MMQLIEVSPGVLQLPARSRSLARSHAYVLEAPGGPLLVEPAHVGDEEREWWVDWIKVHQPQAILLTHHHIDHCNGVDDLQKETGCEIWAPPRGKPTRAAPPQPYTVTRELEEGVSIGSWSVLDVPGHCEHHVVLLQGGVLIAGDAVNPGDGDHVEYLTTLERLTYLDPELVLPAHGSSIPGFGFAPWRQIRDVLADWRERHG
jgi:hydroxyacylglutathione hydrolase